MTGTTPHLALNKVLSIPASSFLVNNVAGFIFSFITEVKQKWYPYCTILYIIFNWWKVVNNLVCHTSLQLYSIVIRNRKRVVGTLAWTWNFWGDRTGNTSKQRKGCLQWGFSFLFEIFRSYCYSAKVSEAVVKIATDEKDYHKCSLCIIVWIATAYQ